MKQIIAALILAGGLMGAPALAQEPSAKAIALARRYVALAEARKILEDEGPTVAQYMISKIPPPAGGEAKATEVKQAMLDAATEAVHAKVPEFLDKTAVIYARVFTEKELADIVAFYDSPSGKAFVAKTGDAAGPMAALIQSLGDDILLGPIAADLFNSPYLGRDDAGPILLSDPGQAGATLLGPLLFAFTAWIIHHPTVRHLRTLFFVSREGWFLKRMYDAVVAASGRTDLPRSVYFHCSRRAALAALQAGGLDTEAVLRGAGFTGSLSDFLLARLGILPDPGLGHQHHQIRQPRDDALIGCMMALMRDQIVSHGQDMARGLAAYAESVGMTAPGPHGFVDVGYSGTMQTALQSVLGTRLVGLYMGVSPAAAQVGAGGGHAFGAFADGDVTDFTGGYGLMLEAFLTAPHGQTIGYDTGSSPPRPLFRHDGHAQTVFPVLDAMFAGALDYATTLMRCWGGEVLAVPFRPQAATAMLEAVRRGRLSLAPDLARALSVEDDFCGSGEIAVFQRLPAAGEAPAS